MIFKEQENDELRLDLECEVYYLFMINFIEIVEVVVIIDIVDGIHELFDVPSQQVQLKCSQDVQVGPGVQVE